MPGFIDLVVSVAMGRLSDATVIVVTPIAVIGVMVDVSVTNYQ